MAKSHGNRQTGTYDRKELVQDMIRNVERHFEVKRYQNPRDVEKHLTDLYQRSERALRKAGRGNREEDSFELSGKTAIRRKQAMVSFLLDLQEKYAEEYPHLDIVDTFGRIDASPLASFRVLEHRKAFMVGAAVWIIDELQRKQMLQEAGLLLTHDADKYMEMALPRMHIPRISDELLKSMLYVICHRNDDRLKKRSSKEINQFAILTEEAAGRGESTEYSRPEIEEKPDLETLKGIYSALTDREKFDAIISMLSKTKVERAVSRFKKATEDYCDRCIRCSDIWYHKCREIADDVNRRFRKIGEREPVKINTVPRRVNPLLMKPELPDLLSPPTDDFMRRLDEQASLMAAAEERLDQLDEAIGARSKFLTDLKVPYDFFWDLSREKAYGAECLEILDGLEIGNPYETCFAFLYLLDSGNDLPWFHAASYAVLSKAANMLPWGQMWDAYDDYWEEDEDEVFIDSDGETAEEQYDYEAERKKYEQYIENPLDLINREKEIYRQSYRRLDHEWRKKKTGEDPGLINIPQYVFELTNVVMPRDARFGGVEAEELTESGFSEEQAGIMLYLNLLACESRYRNYDWSDHLFLDYSYDEEQEEEQKEEVDPEVLKKQNKTYKAELDRLRSQIHDLQKEKKAAEEEMAKIREENALEHQELVDLRETIFNWEHGEQEPVREETVVKLPYEAKARMIVFGGHDTWLKAVRPMLPGVRFVDKDMIPKAETIRNADIVWIQPNAISHAYYYKIMDVARQYKVLVRYFTNASAEKCARQLANADFEMRYQTNKKAK